MLFRPKKYLNISVSRTDGARGCAAWRKWCYRTNYVRRNSSANGVRRVKLFLLLTSLLTKAIKCLHYLSYYCIITYVMLFTLLQTLSTTGSNDVTLFQS